LIIAEQFALIIAEQFALIIWWEHTARDQR
jgi:hypothetical protein